MKKYCVYIRVSTQKQGRSMLGLESQQKICRDFITSNSGECVAEFKDIESGTHRDRKGLADAISYCKKNDCGLVIAKLDRLARDVEFCFKVVNTGIEIHFCDMPNINTLLLGVFASVAQYERELTSDRTKKALAAKKARGERLGGAADKWAESYKNKTKEEIKEIGKKRGFTKCDRYLSSRDVQAFLRVLKNVFPDACVEEDIEDWDWSSIGTKGDSKQRMAALIKDYRDFDDNGVLFKKWDIENWDDLKIQVRLSSQIKNIKRSIKLKNKNQ